MTIGNRDLKQILIGFFEKRHYIELFNSFFIYKNPFDAIKRYLFLNGNYPTIIKVNTKTGERAMRLYGLFDMGTVNEIFCRNDYYASDNIKTVVDVGSNIGLSALYFLSRNSDCNCYLFEPDPTNVKKLKENLKSYNSRYQLFNAALAEKEGECKFGVDPNGKTGGLTRKTGKYIKVKCLDVNVVLQDILEKESFIDILKVDIEGYELNLLRAIKTEYLKKIKTIYFEIDYTITLPADFSFHPEIFNQKRNNLMYVLKNKILEKN
jgi:FkbM family methyltransferase